MACNNQSKKLAAFYHNQQIDYDRWLMANTRNQQRQRWVSTHRSRRDIAMAMAFAAGVSHIMV
jgi:hypothetical protein